MDFENIYTNTTDSLKLKFLEAIIMHNNKLREEFVAFARNEENRTPALSYDNFLELIHTMKSEQIRDLYNHKPNLPALKDEMRKAGLMKN